MRVKEESEKPDLKLNIKKTMNLPCEWRTSASSYTMTPTATPATCTGNTGTWPPPAPSPSATETWVPGTEPGPTQSRSWKWRRSQPANAADQQSSSSTIPRSSSHCPTRSSVTSTSHASPPRGPTPSFRCRPSVPGSAQIKLSGEKKKNYDHVIQSHHFVANRWGRSGNSDRFCFLGLQNLCWLWV